MPFLEYVHREQWVDKTRTVQYGSVWWTVPPTMTLYTEKHLEKWTTREILKMHYYLTSRLDGYRHLTADESIKHNCLLFREVLRQRGVDGVDNCIQNEAFYYGGYRDWVFTSSPIKEKA